MTEGFGLIDSFMVYWTIKLWCGGTNFVVIIKLGCFELTNKELITILNWPCKAHTYSSIAADSQWTTIRLHANAP